MNRGLHELVNVVFDRVSLSFIFRVYVCRHNSLSKDWRKMIGKLVTLPDLEGEPVGLIIGKLPRSFISDESRDAWEVLYSGEDGDYFFESEMIEVTDGYTN